MMIILSSKEKIKIIPKKDLSIFQIRLINIKNQLTKILQIQIIQNLQNFFMKINLIIHSMDMVVLKLTEES